MKFYYRDNADIHVRLYEDQVYKFELDIEKWVEDHETATTATATVRSGNVTAGTPTISSDVITMSLTQTSEGSSRVELKFSGATYTGIQNIYVKYQDRDAVLSDGYGLLS
jgi:hypothetical protein